MKVREMTQPTPTDWGTLGILFTILTGTIALGFKWINEHFKYKMKQDESFIVKVVQASVKATLDSELPAIRGNIDRLFELREEDRKHYDGKLDKILFEIKK